MEIIPGAAYLSLSETRVLYGYAGFSTRGKTVLMDPGTNHILEYDDEIPTDLVLLYAPGDDVMLTRATFINDPEAPVIGVRVLYQDAEENSK